MVQCQATSKRTHERCGAQAVTGRQVCHFHGGATPRGVALPQTKSGRYSKDLPTRLAGAFEVALADPELLSLSPDLALVDAIVSDLIKRIDTGESGHVWRQLLEAKAAYRRAMASHDLDEAKLALEDVWRLVDRGHADLAALGEIGEQLDRRGRLVATEVRRIQFAKETLSTGEAMLLVRSLVMAVREVVRDADILARIDEQFARILGDGTSAGANGGAAVIGG